jgi:magnesium transporter
VITAWYYRSGAQHAEVVTADSLPKPAAGSLLWIDCDGPTAADLELLAGQLGVHEFVIEDLSQGDQRTKLDHYADHFHVAVHDCRLNGDVADPTADVDLTTSEIDVVFGSGWLVSVRQPRSTDDTGEFPMDMVRRRFEAQHRDKTGTDEGFLLWALLDVVVDRYFEVTDLVDDRLDVLQDTVLDGDADRLRRGSPRELFGASKALLHFRRAALPLREVVAQLLRREDPAISDDALVHFQDLYDHVLRVADLVESQRDVLTGLRDADLAVVSNQMSLVQQKIAGWGAILIIATLITGIFGMNFRDAPDVSWWLGFLYAAGIMVVTGLPLFAYFKWRKWI